MDKTLPQPSSDAPEPPPGHHAKRSRWIVVALAITSLIVIAALTLGALNLIRSKMLGPEGDLALDHANHLADALARFDADYGKFPDASTAAAVAAKSSTPLTLGSASSNQLFRQILVTTAFPSEDIFWAETTPKLRKPDNIFSSDSSALRPGEVGFAYITGLSKASDPKTPVAVTPLLPGTLLFDPKPFHGYAVILQVDGTAYATAIDPGGHIVINGMDIFDPRQPYWKGKAPDIKLPE